MSELWNQKYTPSDAAIIKWKVRKIIGKFPFLSRQQEDLQQETAMHMVRQMGRLDPARRREAFVAKVAENKLLNIVERELAQKRDNRRDVSVDAVGEGALLDGSDSSSSVDVVIDVRAVLARLPDDLRQVALLRQHRSERELESLLGLTRAQVRGRLQHIERIFRAAGLAVYSNMQQPNG